MSASPPAASNLPSVRAAAARLGIVLTEKQMAALARYRDLVLDANQRVNLTGVREPLAFERLHLVDALALLRVVGQGELARARLVDIGAGAGLPGIPLAIIAPGLRVTLIEATGKKAAFMEAAAAELGLRGVEVLAGRAEELAHRLDLRERFHLATARAVAALPTLIELSLPFLRIGGRLLAQKKIDIDGEILAAGRALRLLGGEISARVPLALEGLEDRQIVVIRKARPTPPDYPRRPGLPAKQPLIGA